MHKTTVGWPTCNRALTSAFAACTMALAGGLPPAQAQTQRSNAPIDCISVHRLEIDEFYATSGRTGKNPRAEYFVVVRNPDIASGVLFTVTFDMPNLNRQMYQEAYLLRPGQTQRLMLGSRVSSTTEPVPELTPHQIAEHTRLMCE